MSERKIPISERLLLLMHNLGIVDEKRSQTVNELRRTTKIPVQELVKSLRKHEESGYVKGTNDQKAMRYFLTGKGIIRVSSTFT